MLLTDGGWRHAQITNPSRPDPTAFIVIGDIIIIKGVKWRIDGGNWGMQRGGVVVFVHIDESAAPGCECLATLLCVLCCTLSSLEIYSVFTVF
jgi:hypothetical protein